LILLLLLLLPLLLLPIKHCLHNLCCTMSSCNNSVAIAAAAAPAIATLNTRPAETVLHYEFMH
jgi:hypothetical protein